MGLIGSDYWKFSLDLDSETLTVGSLTSGGDIVQLKGDSTGISHYLQNSTTGSGSTDGTQIYLGSDESFGIWNYENTYSLFATNNTERMRILATGSVGIGVVAPDSLFNIASAGGFMGIERFLAGVKHMIRIQSR